MDKKILLFDIETQLIRGLTWGIYETNVVKVEREWFIISFSYKWLGEKQTHVLALPDFEGYKSGTDNDKHLVKKLWDLFDEADIIVGQNLDAFDIKKVNARFAFYKMGPPSPYKTIDTLKIARKHFAFTSNRLNDLGKFLGLGEKIKHPGIEMWFGCEKGDKKSWALMRRYNKNDTILLEKIYLRLLPFMKSHPNLGMYHEDIVCPKCESPNFQYRGYAINATTKYKRAQCQNCSGWFKVGKNLKVIKPGISA